MAKTEDILNFLRQISDTRRASGQMGMQAMQHQGEAFGKVGDRFNEMIDTWVAKGEAKKKRDYEGAEAEKKRGFESEQNMLDAQQREAQMRAQERMNENKMYADALEGDKNRAAQIRIANMRGGDTQKDPSMFNAMAAFADAAGSVNAFDGEVYNYDILKQNKAKVLSVLDNIMQDRVNANFMSDQDKARYMKMFSNMIDDQAAPIPGGGDGKGQAGSTPSFDPAEYAKRFELWKSSGKPTQAYGRGGGGFTPTEIARFLEDDLPAGTY